MDKTKRKCCAALIGMACLTVIVMCYQFGMFGNDYWWHIKVGEWIINNHAIPKTDIFSWYASANGVPFTAHEWLSEVLFYGITHIFGTYGMFIFSVLFAIGFVGVIWWYNRRRIPENNIVGGAVFFILFSALCSIVIYGRPQIFSFVFLWYELFVLYRFMKNENSRLIFTLPVLAVLWANMHGGSSNLSYTLCIMVLVCGIFNFDSYKLEAKRLSARQFKILGLVTVLTAAALCVNPYGTHMLAYPYLNVKDTFMWKLITEWTPPDAKEISQLIIYYIPVFTVLASMVFSNKKVRLTDGIITLFFLFLFFRSQRFISMLLIAASIYVFDYPIGNKNKESKPMTVSKKVAAGGLCVLLAVFSAMAVPSYMQTYRSGNVIKAAMSQEVTELIKKENPQRIFNDYDYGETLIYNDIPVFFDSRADVYSGELISDGATLMYLVSKNSEKYYVDPEELIEKYGFDAFVISTDRALYTYLKSHPERYKELLCDGATGYFSCIE